MINEHVLKKTGQREFNHQTTKFHLRKNLSVIGEICIIEAFLLSQLVYCMQGFVIPDDVLEEFNRLLFRFLWRKIECNRKAFEKVKSLVMCNDLTLEF